MSAGLIDGVILRSRHGRWEFPSGAVLTALFVAMVLSAQTPWYVVCLTSALAIVSKYIVRTRAGNVFNPAALALVALFPVFHAGQSWWGALPEVAPVVQVLLVVTGVFIADRVNRMPLVLAFLGAYYLLFTVTAFVSDPAWVSEVFRTPDLQAVLFFAFFILTDPPTSPIRYRDQMVFAVTGRGRQLRDLRVDGRRLLPAGRRAGWQCVGGMAPGDSADWRRVPQRSRWLSAGDHTLADVTRRGFRSDPEKRHPVHRHLHRAVALLTRQFRKRLLQPFDGRLELAALAPLKACRRHFEEHDVAAPVRPGPHRVDPFELAVEIDTGPRLVCVDGTVR